MSARLEKFKSAGDPLSLSDGTLIFAPGDESQAFLIVTEGAVRVEQTNGAGRTIVLYRVGAGDSCVLTTTSLLSGRAYSGFGYAEGDVKGFAIPPAKFCALLQSDPDFLQLVIENFATRVSELTGVIDDLLEHRTDLRLARWLSERSAQAIEMKQSEIAQELGTAREVVSRALKAFETRGWVRLERGRVCVLNDEALQIHSSSETM